MRPLCISVCLLVLWLHLHFHGMNFFWEIWNVFVPLASFHNLTKKTKLEIARIFLHMQWFKGIFCSCIWSHFQVSNYKRWLLKSAWCMSKYWALYMDAIKRCSFRVEDLPCRLKNWACFFSFLKVILFAWNGNRHCNEVIHLENSFNIVPKGDL